MALKYSLLISMLTGVGFIYTLIQLPFAVYHVSTEKRWIRNGCLPEFDFYGDKVISFLLASGVGVGFGVTFELKRYFDVVSVVAVALGANAAEVDEERSKASHFLDRENIATGILLVGFVTMAITSILTSIMKSASTKGGGGFFR
ncbi:CASP-like protein 4D1 isoform X2 [Coffea arabica]|uniref:CASP-like protein n=1 Tax=Coffea arabica TaxID=13443 RepID=A0ABM4U1K5_COFAR